MNIDELLRDVENFIGHVVEVRDSDNIKSYCRYDSAADFVCLSLFSSQQFNSSSSYFVQSCPLFVLTYQIHYFNLSTVIYIRDYHLFQVRRIFLMAPHHVMDKLHKPHRHGSCNSTIPLKPFDRSISVLASLILT